MLVAQLDFMRVQNISVAAIVTTGPFGERAENGDGELRRFCDCAVDHLYGKSVRVLVYKESREEFRELLQTKMQYTQIANKRGAVPSFFVLGPVEETKKKNQARGEMISMTSTRKEDPTKRWAPISFLQLKECKTGVEKSTRILVCRRTEVVLAERVVERKHRWENKRC